MQNSFIKEYAKLNGIYLWRVAEAMGMHDSNFSKLLRYPLPKKKEDEICRIIDELAALDRERRCENEEF